MISPNSNKKLKKNTCNNYIVICITIISKMTTTTPAKPTYYLYELALNTHAWKLYKSDPYTNDSVIKMIVSATSDVEARMIAITKEWGGDFPGRNATTSMFWGPTIEEQIQYIQCVPIGTSFVLETRLICTSEGHT